MQEIITNTKSRILYLAEKEEVSKQVFFRKINASYGNFTGKSKDSEPSNAVIREILLNYPQVNPIWLVTGNGDVLVKEERQEISTKPEGVEAVSESVVAYSSPIPNGAVPFYNLPVSAGRSIFDMEGAMKPDGYLKDIPGVGLTEAFLPVHGYSMHPEVKEGAMIGVRKTERWDHLNTQHKYLIITVDDRMVKYIEHDFDDKSILWCKSPNYNRFSILKEDIVEVHRVTFVMNPE